MTDFLPYWPVIVVVSNLLAMWVWWSAKKSFATRDEVTGLGNMLNESVSGIEKHADRRLDDHNIRLTRIEEAMKRVPTHDDLSRVYERLNSINTSVKDVSGEVKGIGGELSAVRRSVDMMNQYLLGGDK